MQLLGQVGSIVNALAIVGVTALLIWFGLRPAMKAILESKGSAAGCRGGTGSA